MAMRNLIIKIPVECGSSLSARRLTKDVGKVLEKYGGYVDYDGLSRKAIKHSNGRYYMRIDHNDNI